MNHSVSVKRHQPCIKDKNTTSHARSKGFGWSSSNWSGYALRGKRGAYHRISGEWHVPFVKPSARSAYSSAWIGIDGFGNSNLIQTGTGHTFENGKAHYYAWWEILPAFETIIPLPVSPGDAMQASIVKISRTKWCITLRNLSRKWTFRTHQCYTGPQSSAEWILEAPQVGGRIAALARVSRVSFNRCRINGKRAKLTPVQGGIMVQNKITIAVPTCPSACGDAFTVRRIYPHKSPSACMGSPVRSRSIPRHRPH
ncbi:hypothetical protein A8L34_17225 [Bacillus sp. FJAT-27264]|uniref:G1 family glutamic endopeptidase n=1 Tax=Paenibacillus sp. (strain DSM 101736 / FJAT-27264) TaxID=1850362 RepID=UPI000807B041|nr:G1 family glutamic endopeptidase [Bacillus sp. FJAT-27264]OBZ12050.1 hypothetical protein A8L34_17225 [Bacillus sp. FJAT-27264]